MATSDYTSEIPYGYCKCGCGNQTPLASKTISSYGLIKGKPINYIKGHTHKFNNKTRYELFWSYVAIAADDNQCWEWKGGLFKNGYGMTSWKNRTRTTHKIAWEYPNYIIPKGMIICHSCDNPKCCNPRHLFLGTHQDNSTDSKNKNRNAKHERNAKAKMTEAKVQELRILYDNGEHNISKLSRMFNISRTQINKIVHRIHWI